MSEATLRRDIAASDISLDSSIQVSILAYDALCVNRYTVLFKKLPILDEAARIHPDSWWWLKADGCDLTSGLSESVSGKWSGDVNIDQEALKKLYQAYQNKLSFVSELGTSDDKKFMDDLVQIETETVEEIKLINSCTTHNYREYIIIIIFFCNYSSYWK